MEFIRLLLFIGDKADEYHFTIGTISGIMCFTVQFSKQPFVIASRAAAKQHLHLRQVQVSHVKLVVYKP
ncbi:MAG: hypothetical protein EHM33_11845 [Chloroflexi bacterium]|nr:MAG: hypothetical protein EHM33_11845 [Chloroflexota bacterium]